MSCYDPSIPRLNMLLDHVSVMCISVASLNEVCTVVNHDFYRSNIMLLADDRYSNFTLCVVTVISSFFPRWFTIISFSYFPCTVCDVIVCFCCCDRWYPGAVLWRWWVRSNLGGLRGFLPDWRPQTGQHRNLSATTYGCTVIVQPQSDPIGRNLILMFSDLLSGFMMPLVCFLMDES